MLCDCIKPWYLYCLDACEYNWNMDREGTKIWESYSCSDVPPGSILLAARRYGSGKGLAPGGEEVPPGGLHWFRLAALGVAPSDNAADYDLFTLVWRYKRGRFVCSVLTLERCCEHEGTWLVDHICWTTGGQIRRVGLRVGRFIEAGPRAGMFVSPFLFVIGDDRVIRHTGADDDTGDAEAAQATNGSGKGLAPGGEEVPPGGLHWFRLAALGVAPSDNAADYDLFTLVWRYKRGRFVCSVLTLERCCEHEGTWLVDHICWTTGGQIRRVGLRVGRFIEAGPRAGMFVSPFLFVIGDDRVIRHTGADDDTGDAEAAQATK
ncbi:hypothetical protein DEO72_LG9g1813 [Vigna unguiculata]|uniref:Uncharacterized protein n=1 Tax=Vigna unguiculata TaxID=3917 RepID=A0A4D6N2Q7_VIGUN|nr:hypothetical protein DEO72_LG9g1813 [Vigna unguiculata]